MEPAQALPHAIVDLRALRDLLDKRVETTGR